MIKYFKILLCAYAVIGVMGCIKEYVSTMESFLINNTAHQIEVVPYYGGIANMSARVQLSPGQRLSVAREGVRGRSLAATYAMGLQSFDSVVVIYDNLYRVTHRSFRDSTACTKCITFSSNRNISSESSYLKTITKEHRKYLRGYFEYSFTEDDYNFARN